MSSEGCSYLKKKTKKLQKTQILPFTFSLISEVPAFLASQIHLGDGDPKLGTVL